MAVPCTGPAHPEHFASILKTSSPGIIAPPQSPRPSAMHVSSYGGISFIPRSIESQDCVQSQLLVMKDGMGEVPKLREFDDTYLASEVHQNSGNFIPARFLTATKFPRILCPRATLQEASKRWRGRGRARAGRTRRRPSHRFIKQNVSHINFLPCSLIHEKYMG